jgi:uncharacterized repeat protein (TIGR01451 family)
MKTRIGLPLFTLLVGLCLASAHAAVTPGDGSAFQHDARHTGRSAYAGITAPALLGTYGAGGPLTTAAVRRDDGQLYLGTPGHLVRLDLLPDGQPGIGQVFAADTGSATTPAIGADGTVYVGSADGKLYAFDPDGTALWNLKVGAFITAAPTLGANGTLYVAAGHGITAVNTATHTPIWTYVTGGEVRNAPAVAADGTVYVGSLDGNLYAFATDGTMKWSVAMGGAVTASPAVGDDGTVYTGSINGKLYAIGTDGAVQWSFPTGAAILATPALGADGTIYIGSTNGKFYAINADGTPKWVYATGGAIASSAALGTNDLVYFGSGDKRVYALRAADGTPEWLYLTGGAVDGPPTIGADGAIYVGAGDGQLYVLNAADALREVALGNGVSTPSALVGKRVVFTVTAKANGNVAVHDVTVRSTLPTWLTLVAGSITGGGAYDAGTRTITWHFPYLANTLNPTPMSFTVQVDDGTAVGTQLTNDIAATCADVVEPFPCTPAVLTVIAPQGGGAWSMLGHDAQHTGRSTQNAITAPEVIWGGGFHYRTEYQGVAVGADGTMYYVYSYNGAKLRARSPDCTVLWDYALPGEVGHYTPAVGPDGTIYVGVHGQFIAVNPDGTPQWAVPTGGEVYSSPIIGPDGTIYWGCNDQKVYALDPRDGAVKWTYTITAPLAISTPAVSPDGKTLYIGGWDWLLHAVDTATGQQRWATALNFWVGTPVVAPDGTIFVNTVMNPGGYQNATYAINPADGSIRWKVDSASPLHGSPALGPDGTVYVGSTNNLLYALNPGDGTQKWASDLMWPIYGELAVTADGIIYAGTDSGRLFAVDPADGTLLWGAKLDRRIASVSIGANGMVYAPVVYNHPYVIAQAAEGKPVLTLSQSMVGATLPGKHVHIDLIYNNTGNVRATAMTIVNQLPVGVTYVEGSATNGGTYDQASHSITWQLGGMINTLDARRVSFAVAVADAATAGTVYTNAAEISCAEVTVPTAAALTSFTILAKGGQGDWHTWHRDMQRTGRSPVAGPTMPMLKWSSWAGNMDHANPVLDAEGTVYTASSDQPWGVKGPLLAHTPATGAAKWSFSPGDSIRTLPTVGADGTIYISGAGSNYALYAINPDGSTQWEFQHTMHPYRSVAIGADGTIFAAGNENNVWALDPRGGEPKWMVTLEGEMGSPSLGPDGTLYVTSGWTLYALNPDDGAVLWTAGSDGAPTTVPVIANGKVYLGTSWYDNMQAFDAQDGTLAWKTHIGGTLQSTPAIGLDGTLYFGSDNASFYALDGDTGAVKWSFGTNSWIRSAPVLDVNGLLYVPNGEGLLYCLDSGTGTPIWTKKVDSGYYSPSLGADGTLYLVSGDQLLAIGQGVETPKMTLSKAVLGNAMPGKVVNYTLTYQNTGTMTGHDVVITDMLPETLTYKAGSASHGGTYDAATRTLVWRVPYVIGQWPAVTMSFKAYVNDDVAPGTTIDNVGNIVCNAVSTDSNRASFTVLDTGAPGEWFTFQHDMQRTGRSPYTGPSAPKVLWTTALQQNATPPVLDAAGNVYTGAPPQPWDGTGWMHVVQPDGAYKWAWHTDSRGVDSTPTIGADGTVYVLGEDQRLYAVNPDGSTQWVAGEGLMSYTSVALGTDGTVYAGGWDGRFYAFDPRSGDLKWAAQLSGTCRGQSVGPDGTIYVGTEGWMCYALKPEDGTILWAAGMDAGTHHAPAIADGRVYLGTSNGTLFAFDAATGTEVWRYKADGYGIESTPAIGTDGTVYYGSSNYGIYALDGATGTMKWCYGTSDRIVVSPLLDANNVLYVRSEDRLLYAINATTGVPNWTIMLNSGTGLALAPDGTLYLSGDELFAIGQGTATPQLTISKACTGSAMVGKVVDYGITYRNTAIVTAHDVVITDVLPAGITYQEGSAKGATYDDATRTLTWHIAYVVGNVPAVTLKFKALVNDTAVPLTTIDNTACITCTEVPEPVVSDPASFTVILPTGAGDWFTYHRDMQRTGRSPNRGPSLPTILWTANAQSSESSPVLDQDSTIYTTAGPQPWNGTGVMFAFQVNGVAKWTYSTNSRGVSSQPTVGSDGTVYVVGEDGILYAVNPDGTFQWSAGEGLKTWESVALAKDGTIYAAGADGRFWAFKPAGGAVMWTVQLNSTCRMPSVDPDGTIYVGTEGWLVYALNPTDGSTKWQAGVTGHVQTAPAVGNGRVYVGTGWGYVYALDAKTGAEVWNFHVDGYGYLATPTLGADGTVYVGSENGTMYALSPEDGTAKWTFGTGGNIRSSAALDSAGHLYFASRNTYFYCVDAKSGVTVWSMKLHDWAGTDCSPAIGPDGTLYLAHSQNGLYAIGQAPQLVLTAPTTGTVWQRDTAQTITWDSLGAVGPKVKLELLKPDGTVLLLGDDVPNIGTFAWTPDAGLAPSTGYQVRITSVDDAGVTHTGSYFAITDESGLEVIFTATPDAPVLVGMPVQLAAESTSSIPLEYRFLVTYRTAGGKSGTALSQPFGAATAITWTPEVAGKYYLYCYARERGRTNVAVTRLIGAYTVLASLTDLHLGVSPEGISVTEMPVTLKAAVTGGRAVEFAFAVTYEDGDGQTHDVYTRDFAPESVCSWTPTQAGTYQLTVSAREVGTLETLTDTVFDYLVKPAISDMSFTATPGGPVLTGTPVSLDTLVVGGNVVDVKYLITCRDAQGNSQTVFLRGYAPETACTWVPTVAGTYYLYASVRERGRLTYNLMASINRFVVKEHLSGVSLSATPNAPVAPGVAVRLKAAAAGGLSVAYRFDVVRKNGDGTTTPVTTRDAGATGTCVWTPMAAGTYALTVTATDSADLDALATQTLDDFIVNAPITGLTFTATPGAPAATGMAVTLSATAIGGGTPEYRFVVAYRDGQGAIRTAFVRDFATTATCTWTPDTTATYYLYAYARERGQMAVGAAYVISRYVVKTALSGVTLGVTPASPTAVGMPVTLTATPVDGAAVEYRFAISDGTTDVFTTDYSRSRSVIWVPDVDGIYTLTVYAREVGGGEEFTASVTDFLVCTPLEAVDLASSHYQWAQITDALQFTANVNGGGSVEYKFQITMRDAQGHCPVVAEQNYGPSNILYWTPSALGTYYITVYVRERGTTRFSLMKTVRVTVVP